MDFKPFFPPFEFFLALCCSQLSRVTFPRHLTIIWRQISAQTNLENGFRDTGISPFDPQVIRGFVPSALPYPPPPPAPAAPPAPPKLVVDPVTQAMSLVKIEDILTTDMGISAEEAHFLVDGLLQIINRKHFPLIFPQTFFSKLFFRVLTAFCLIGRSTVKRFGAKYEKRVFPGRKKPKKAVKKVIVWFVNQKPVAFSSLFFFSRLGPFLCFNEATHLLYHERPSRRRSRKKNRDLWCHQSWPLVSPIVTFGVTLLGDGLF